MEIILPTWGFEPTIPTPREGSLPLLASSFLTLINIVYLH